MASRDPDSAFTEWITSLTALTSSADAARGWRERRYRFAYRLGSELTAETSTHPPVVGSAVYGIWLKWGLLYIGETLNAKRRLRDLPVGESHHVSNTFPPEIWDRVVVIDWAALPEAQDPLSRIDHQVIGRALEYRLQKRFKPLVNEHQRTRHGGWRVIDRSKSQSRGARAAHLINELSEKVDQLWNRAAAHEAGAPTLPASTRCVRPTELFRKHR